MISERLSGTELQVMRTEKPDLYEAEHNRMHLPGWVNDDLRPF